MIKCKVCGNKTKILYTDMKDYRYPNISNRHFEVYKCSKCGSGVSFPEMSTEELGSFYPDYYENYNLGKGIIRDYLSSKKRREMKNLRQCFGFEKRPRLFEIGCGSGESLHYAEQCGFEVYGSDIDGKGIATAKEKFGITVFSGSSDDIELDNASYDVIMMRHALEHVNNPTTILEKIYRGLKKDGAIFLVLPRFDCFERTILGKYSMVQDMPRHRVHFSRKGIEFLLMTIGFRDINIECKSAPSFMARGWYWKYRDLSFCGKIMMLLFFPVYVLLFLVSIFYRPNVMNITARK